MFNSYFSPSHPGKKLCWQESLEVESEVPSLPTSNWTLRPRTDLVVLYIFKRDVYINNFVRNLLDIQKQGKEAYHLLTIALKKWVCERMRL